MYCLAVKSYDTAGNASDFSAEVSKVIPRLDLHGLRDFDGEGKSDLAVFRPETGDWLILESGTGRGTTTHWGGPDDVPVPGDYKGDGKSEPALWRPTTEDWWVAYGEGAHRRTVRLGGGVPGDAAAPGDYDGDGKTDLALWRPSDASWHIAYTGGGSRTQERGRIEDIKLGAYFTTRIP
jgi:hypothetical protein